MAVFRPFADGVVPAGTRTGSLDFATPRLFGFLVAALSLLVDLDLESTAAVLCAFLGGVPSGSKVEVSGPGADRFFDRFEGAESLYIDCDLSSFVHVA